GDRGGVAGRRGGGRAVAGDDVDRRGRRGGRGPARGCRALVRPAVPVPLVPAGRGQVRVDAAAQRGPAAGAGRDAGRRAAADRARVGQPVPGTGAGRGVARCSSPRRSDGSWPGSVPTAPSASWAVATST